MIKLVAKLIPILISVLTRGRVLFSAYKSKTTQKQYGVVGLVCMLIAAIGYFVPELRDDAIAGALITLLAPLVSRYALYKEKVVDSAVDSVPLVKVANPSGGDSWIIFEGTVADARGKGFHLGVGEDGTVWDIATGESLGMIRLKEEVSDEQKAKNLKVFKKVLAAIKAKEQEKDSCP